MLANRAANFFHTHIAPGPLSCSDHIPIFLTVSVNPILIPSTPHLSYKRADWDAFKHTLNTAEYTTDYDNRPTHDIDQQWERIHQLILDAANTHIPKTHFRIHYDFRPSPRTQRLLACYRRRFDTNLHNLRRVHLDLSTASINTYYTALTEIATYTGHT